MQQPFACPESTVRSWKYCTVGIIFSVCCDTCRVLLLLPHTSHCFQSEICSWMLAGRPCQKQWMCSYTFKHQVLASWRESSCCLVFSKGLFPKAQGTTLLQNNKLPVFPSTTHTLCGNLREFIWEKQGWTALRSGRKHLFLFLIFLIVKRSASPPGHGTHCIALAWIAYISACEVHTITSLHEAQPRLYTTGDVAGSSNTSWRNNTCEEFYCCVHFWCREREGTAGWGKGKEQIFTFWGSKATVTSVQIFYMMLLYADCSASILNNSLF